jgi:hypothetical protein
MAIDGHCCPTIALSPSSLYKSRARAPASHPFPNLLLPHSAPLLV